MDGFLILIEASAGCAVGALIGWKAERRYEQHRQSQRRKQALIQALHAQNSEPSITGNPHFSDKGFQMELLLMNLTAKTEALREALTSEAELGEKAIGTGAGIGQWEEARRAVAQAQEVYSESLDAFREFLHSLPPPLRAK